MEASLGTGVVQVAAPGDLVLLTTMAVDPDGGSLHYKWRSTTPGFASQDSATINWQLPTSAGQNTVYLEVSDESGGFATQTLSISTGASDALFQGTVIDRDSGLPIIGAEVTVGGVSASTSTRGTFAIQAPRADRYVLNSEKHGYAFVSQVFHASTVALKIRMRSQPVVMVVPTVETILVASSERNTLMGSLRIPANCLADRSGALPPGNLSASFYTYDPTEADGIPGDFSAIDANQSDVRLESFGAFGIDVWDPVPGGEVPYTLAPGCQADFDLEIPGSMLGYAQASIPLLEYDPVRGYWDEAALPATRIGGIWSGAVPGFSAWNMDMTFTDSACIQLVVDPETAPYPFTLRVTIPTGNPAGSGIDKVKEFPVTDSPNGLFRLPPNQDIKLEMMDGFGQQYVYKTIIANSKGIVTEAFPPSPFSDCQGIDNATGESPVVLGLVPPTHNRQWLSRKGGIHVGNTPALVSEADQIAETEAYYDVIDPQPDPLVDVSPKDTLAKWKAANGFQNGNDVTAIYYNNLDLKLGRQMHCRKTVGGGDDGDVACWVTNFGEPGGPSQIGLKKATDHAGDGSLPTGATVTMEYDASLASSAIPNQVKFFVFAPDGERVPRVALDSEGEKPVPQICLVCHGGEYIEATHSVAGSAFREFDVFGFEYQDSVTYDLNGQQEAFRQLNAMVKSTNPKVDDDGFSPIVELIDGFYPGGVDVPFSVATDTYVPGPWSDANNLNIAALYNQITKPHCRACHLAQDGDLNFYGFFPFRDSVPQYSICNLREMPHAQAPFNNFWLNTRPPGTVGDPLPAAYLGDAITGLDFSGEPCPAP
jgi:hypothetical protein